MATNDPKIEQLGYNIRLDLGNAYAYVLGRQSVQSFAAVTPEELMDQAIEQIEGVGTDARPSDLMRLSNLQTSLGTAIDRIKQVPLDASSGAEADNTNTTPDDQEEDPVARQQRITGSA